MKKTKKIITAFMICLMAFSSILIADPNRKNLCKVFVVDLVDGELHDPRCVDGDGTCFDDFVIIADPLPELDN